LSAPAVVLVGGAAAQDPKLQGPLIMNCSIYINVQIVICCYKTSVGQH
jgi:hypothetical protein